MELILTILKATVVLLLAVQANPAATNMQRQQAIATASSAVQIVQAYAASQATVPATVQDSGAWVEGHWETNPTKISTDPIVYVEGSIRKSDGTETKLLGVNANSARRQLGIPEETFRVINQYNIVGYYATSSLSKNERVSITIGFNPNANPSYKCSRSGSVGWSDEIGTDQVVKTEPVPAMAYTNAESDLQFNLQSHYNPYVEESFGVQCTATSTTAWGTEVKASAWDSITVKFVE